MVIAILAGVALAASSSESPAPKCATPEARAIIRILKAVIVTKETWRTHDNRQERTVTDADGQQRQLRTIEFE
jgi:hypothetical protein